jgi:hypothetical protein
MAEAILNTGDGQLPWKKCRQQREMPAQALALIFRNGHTGCGGTEHLREA